MLTVVVTWSVAVAHAMTPESSLPDRIIVTVFRDREEVAKVVVNPGDNVGILNQFPGLHCYSFSYGGGVLQPWQIFANITFPTSRSPWYLRVEAIDEKEMLWILWSAPENWPEMRKLADQQAAQWGNRPSRIVCRGEWCFKQRLSQDDPYSFYTSSRPSVIPPPLSRPSETELPGVEKFRWD